MSSDSAMIILTETHLSPDILDAEISIGPNWILYRSDREGRTHGGCAVYVRRDLVSDLVVTHSNSYCDTLAIKVKTLETLVIVNYRPPGSPYDKFEEALNVSQEAVDSTMKKDSKIRTIFQLGDYNFPCISWPSRKIYVQENRENKASEKLQAELLLTYADNNFLENVVETPTRNKAILDLAFSNNHALVNYYTTIINKKLTDHCTLKFSMNFTYNMETKVEKATNPYSTKMFEYNTKDADEEDWERFAHFLENSNYEANLEGKDADEKLKYFYKTLEEVTELTMNRKK